MVSNAAVLCFYISKKVIIWKDHIFNLVTLYKELRYWNSVAKLKFENDTELWLKNYFLVLSTKKKKKIHAYISYIFSHYNPSPFILCVLILYCLKLAPNEFLRNSIVAILFTIRAFVRRKLKSGKIFFYTLFWYRWLPWVSNLELSSSKPANHRLDYLFIYI